MAQFQFYPHPDWKMPLVPLNDEATELSLQLDNLLTPTTLRDIRCLNELVVDIRRHDKWRTKLVHQALQLAQNVSNSLECGLRGKAEIVENIEWIQERAELQVRPYCYTCKIDV